MLLVVAYAFCRTHTHLDEFCGSGQTLVLGIVFFICLVEETLFLDYVFSTNTWA